jgi:hypothetical protein
MDWAESEKRSRIRGRGARMRQVVTKYRRIEAGGCRSWAGQGGRRYHSTSKEEVVLGHGEGCTRKLGEAMTLDQEMIRVRGGATLSQDQSRGRYGVGATTIAGGRPERRWRRLRQPWEK